MIGPGPTSLFEAQARAIEDDWFQSLPVREQIEWCLVRAACLVLLALALVPTWLTYALR